MKRFMSLLIETIGGDKCSYNRQLIVFSFQLIDFDVAIHLFLRHTKLGWMLLNNYRGMIISHRLLVPG